MPFIVFIRWLFSPEVAGIGAVFFAGVGFTMALAPTRRNIRRAHWFFTIAGVWCFGAVLEWLMNLQRSAVFKPLIAFLACGLIGAAWIWVYGWVESNHEEHAKLNQEQNKNSVLHSPQPAPSPGYYTPKSKPIPSPYSHPDEVTRRKILMERLRNEYMLSHDNLNPALIAGTEQPPSDWINKRLRELGEKWMVKDLTHKNRRDSSNTDTRQSSTGANSPIVSAPNGIAIGGGIVNNPTVNNYAPPERRLSPEQRRIIVAALSGKKLNVEFGASFSIADAPRYAQDLHDAFKAAGIEVKDEIPAVMMARDTGHGVEIMFHGPEHAPGTMVYLEEGTPERTVSDAIQMARIPSSVHSDMNQKPGVVTVIIVKP